MVTKLSQAWAHLPSKGIPPQCIPPEEKSIKDENDAEGLISEITKEMESLRNSNLVPEARKMPGEMDRFDKLDMLNLESALDRERRPKQVLAEAPPFTLDRAMKVKEKYQSDLWLEIERLNKGIVQQDPNMSSLALFNTPTNPVDQCETLDNKQARLKKN
ncbi:serine/threonine-protein kinase MRCK alpha-like [Trichechus inunguis]